MPVTSRAGTPSSALISAAVCAARVATECSNSPGRDVAARAKARAWSRPNGVSAAPGGRVSSRLSTLA